MHNIVALKTLNTKWSEKTKGNSISVVSYDWKLYIVYGWIAFKATIDWKCVSMHFKADSIHSKPEIQCSKYWKCISNDDRKTISKRIKRDKLRTKIPVFDPFQNWSNHIKNVWPAPMHVTLNLMVVIRTTVYAVHSLQHCIKQMPIATQTSLAMQHFAGERCKMKLKRISTTVFALRIKYSTKLRFSVFQSSHTLVCWASGRDTVWYQQGFPVVRMLKWLYVHILLQAIFNLNCNPFKIFVINRLEWPVNHLDARSVLVSVSVSRSQFENVMSFTFHQWLSHIRIVQLHGDEYS